MDGDPYADWTAWTAQLLAAVSVVVVVEFVSVPVFVVFGPLANLVPLAIAIALWFLHLRPRLVGSALAKEALEGWLRAYMVTDLASAWQSVLGFFAFVGGQGFEGPLTLAFLAGLCLAVWQRRWLVALLPVATMLLALAGIPLTAGFVAKFYLFTAGIEAARWTLVITLIIGSAIGLFYYLRIIVALARPATATAPAAGIRLSDGIVLGHVMQRGEWSLEVDEEARREVMENHIRTFSAMRAPELIASGGGRRSTPRVPEAPGPAESLTGSRSFSPPPVESFFDRVS